MSTTFKLTTIVQNLWAASRTKAAIRHRIPDLGFSTDGYLTGVREIVTATANPGFVNNDGQLYTIGGGSVVLNPVTGGDMTIGKLVGYALYVGRAADDTAPTGTPTLEVTGWAGVATDGAVNIHEGTMMIAHSPGVANSVDAQGIEVNLTGTTGYKVSLIVWFTPAA
jgi:hypothetical protein